jgi:hypothetical protein
VAPAIARFRQFFPPLPVRLPGEAERRFCLGDAIGHPAAGYHLPSSGVPAGPHLPRIGQIHCSVGGGNSFDAFFTSKPQITHRARKPKIQPALSKCLSTRNRLLLRLRACANLYLLTSSPYEGGHTARKGDGTGAPYRLCPPRVRSSVEERPARSCPLRPVRFGPALGHRRSGRLFASPARLDASAQRIH